MITVLCVRFGTKYGIEYVERLRNMVTRHLTVPFEFVCLTDDSTPIKGVRLIVQKNAGYHRAWWHKIHMFDPSLPLQERILYLDLDVVIINNIDKLFSNNGNFYGILDFNRKFNKDYKSLNSSVLLWNYQTQNIIWDNFVSNSSDALKLHGDQDWIWKLKKEEIKFWPVDWIQSYKWEIRSKSDLELRNGKRVFKQKKDIETISSNCSILVFHGDPKPQDVQDKIVIDNWR
jgi:hypothetical protein